jgi:hypothetical protein
MDYLPYVMSANRFGLLSSLFSFHCFSLIGQPDFEWLFFSNLPMQTCSIFGSRTRLLNLLVLKRKEKYERLMRMAHLLVQEVDSS